MKKVANSIRKSYLDFINIRLYKFYFSLQLLGLVKKDRVKRFAISSVKKRYHKLEKLFNST